MMFVFRFSENVQGHITILLYHVMLYTCTLKKEMSFLTLYTYVALLFTY